MSKKIWNIPSQPPHDFYLCLDVDSYFDYEHNPEVIFDNGFTRPIPLSGRDILVTIFFNGDVDAPEFTVKAHEALSKTEQSEADTVIRRILGTDLDLAPFYEQAGDDPVLGPAFQELYGLKRISRAHFFEDAVNRIIQTQIKHKPTAKKMVYGVRTAYGTRLESDNEVIPAWPRPQRLLTADPVSMKKHGLSLRKGEYLTGLAYELLYGRFTSQSMERTDTPSPSDPPDNARKESGNTQSVLHAIEKMPPRELYERLVTIRGIGPTTAQDLILFRNRTDGYFASHMDRGREKAVRRWIILSYGGDPDHCDEAAFREMIRYWDGYEAAALEFLYVNWVISEKRAAGM